MSSTKKFNLGQVAFQSSCAYNALNSVRKLCMRSGATNAALLRQKGASLEKKHEELSSPPANKAARVGHLSKVIGVKKTLVNQMQGMVQRIRPHVRSQSLLLSQKNNSSKYRIYGQTRLFSSKSSLASSSAMLHSTSSRQLPQLQRRRFSHASYQPRALPQGSVVQQRYSQLGHMYDRRKGEMAKDISRSIQSELMDVDLTTKRLISCAHNKPDLLAEQSEQEAQRQRQQEQQKQMQLRINQQNYQQPPLRYNPFKIWKQQRAAKPAAEDTVDEADEAQSERAATPMRRRSSDQPQEEQEDKRKSRKLKVKLSELYASSNKKNRNLQSQSALAAESPMPTDSEAEKLAYYKQLAAERNAITSERERQREREEAAALAYAGSNRMDDQHYQTKIESNLLSASQRLYNKRYEGYRNQVEARSKEARPMFTRNAVQPVSLLEQSKPKNETESPAPTTPVKTITSRPLSARCMYKPAGKSKSSAAKSNHVTPKARAQKKLLKKLNQTMSKSSKLNVPNRRDKSMRYKSDNSGSNWSSPTHSNYEQHLRQVCEMPRGQNIRMGEMREPHISDKNYTSDSLQNYVQMPREYTKESAVRRLGSVYDRRNGHAHFGKQRMLV